MSEDLTNQLFEYLEGKMTESQRRLFEKKLAEDKELNEEVRDLKALDEGLKAAGLEEFRADLKKWDSDSTSAVSDAAPGWKKYLAVAAVIALILVPAIYFFTDTKATSEELFLAYYQPYEEMITSRGDSVNELLADGMEAYNNGAYQQCSNLLISYLEQEPEAHRVALYLAIAQLELDQRESAEANFLRAQEDPVFRQQAQWYQALAYLKFSEPEKARLTLESIVNSPSHYRKKEAGWLLKELG